jgi:hypothetical protein
MYLAHIIPSCCPTCILFYSGIFDSTSWYYQPYRLPLCSKCTDMGFLDGILILCENQASLFVECWRNIVFTAAVLTCIVSHENGVEQVISYLYKFPVTAFVQWATKFMLLPFVFFCVCVCVCVCSACNWSSGSRITKYTNTIIIITYYEPWYGDWLDGRGHGIPVALLARIFFSSHFPDGSGVHPVSYPTGTAAVSLGARRLKRESNNSLPTSVEVNNTWINTFKSP